MVGSSRLIFVACTPDMKCVLECTRQCIEEYAVRCGATVHYFLGNDARWYHGKFRIFEAGEYPFHGDERVLIMDADVKPLACAPDIYKQYPRGNWMVNELEVMNHHVELHRQEVISHLLQCGIDTTGFCWDKSAWWNPGVALLDAEAVRSIYQMPPYNPCERRFHVGGNLVVKNMPWINYRINAAKINIGRLDRRYNTFSTRPNPEVRRAHFLHYVCQQAPENRNEIKVQMLKGPRHIHCVMGRDQKNWILGRMWRAIQETAPEGAICTDGKRPMNQAGVINYYNPYRGYRHKTQGHDVVFCTHPEIPTTWARATRDADHIVVMADKWRQHLIEQGVPAHKITHVPPGVDGWFLDPRLRIFNPCKMPDGSYGERKGRGLWQRLIQEPWLECICSGGAMSEAELRLQYLAADAIVSTAVPDYGGEGGPMSCKEGLALCKPTVMPAGIGLVDEHADHPCLLRYPAGDYDALIEVLKPLYHAKVNAKMAATDWTWEAWGKAHWDIFNRLIQGLTQPQAAPQARRVKDKTVPLFFSDHQRDKPEILEYVTNKGFIPVEADSPEGAIDLTAVAGKPVFTRNRFLKQQLGAYK